MLKLSYLGINLGCIMAKKNKAQCHNKKSFENKMLYYLYMRVYCYLFCIYTLNNKYRGDVTTHFSTYSSRKYFRHMLLEIISIPSYEGTYLSFYCYMT